MTGRADPPAGSLEAPAPAPAELAATELVALQAATAALSAARTPDAVAEAALAGALRVLGAARGFVLAPAPGGAALVLLRAEGLDDGALEGVATAEGSPAREAWITGEPVFREEGAAAPAAAWARAGAVAALPLSSAGRPVGVLVAVLHGPRRFTPADRTLAAMLATACAEALDRARLLTAERLARAEAVAAQRRLAFLDALSTFLARGLDEAALLEGVAQLTVPALADSAAVLLAAGDGPPRVAALAGDPALGERARALAAASEPRPLAGGGPGRARTLAEGAGPGATALAWLSHGGEVLGAVVLATHEPERRYGAGDLELLEEVARRTALAVAHARALEGARAAARLREEFLQVASHELRGPLTTLRLAVQLASRELAAGAVGAAAERLAVVTRQVDRLTRLTERLLDVTRLGEGRLHLRLEPVDLTAVSGEVVARLAEEAAEAGCALTFDAPGPLPLRGDPERLDEVVVNLVGNALKYGRGAPVAVRVTQQDDRAVLEVQDRGIGIAPEDQARIFERFERAAPPRQFGGLGLGLWIVRAIVAAHGGAIGVRSTPGSGAVFTVELPLALESPEPARA